MPSLRHTPLAGATLKELYDSRFDNLEAYKAKHGHCNVLEGDTFNEEDEE